MLAKCPSRERREWWGHIPLQPASLRQRPAEEGRGALLFARRVFIGEFEINGRKCGGNTQHNRRPISSVFVQRGLLCFAVLSVVAGGEMKGGHGGNSD